jgi:tRNA modification GTPase
VFSPDDTIVAIATPPGRGGIGVVRISGEDAAAVAAQLLSRRAPLEPRYATLTRLRRAAPAGTGSSPPVNTSIGDEVVATSFPAPHSYTGQHVIEISAHGSPVVLEAIVRSAVVAGARLARPGEFTLRAFLNGRRDLVQAEAVADLIEAATPLQARVAFDQLEGTLTRRIAAIDAELFDLIARLEASLDFPDEGYHFIAPAEIADRCGAIVNALTALLADGNRGRLIREGATVVILGRPNVGKSSLFNVLAGTERSIVTDIPGTTRDLVTERVDICGIPLTLVDTAGARTTDDIIEREGVARGVGAQQVANLVLLVLDGSAPETQEDRELLERTAQARRLIVRSKADLTGPSTHVQAPGALSVSATTGLGIGELREAMVAMLGGTESGRDTAAISNTRHLGLLEDARRHLAAAQDAAARGDTPEEFVLVDLQAARSCFDEIVGTRTSDDVLRHIFDRFCIGK